MKHQTLTTLSCVCSCSCKQRKQEPIKQQHKKPTQTCDLVIHNH